MNWAHKEVGLGWIGLVENVSRKWVSTIYKIAEDIFMHKQPSTLMKESYNWVYN